MQEEDLPLEKQFQKSRESLIDQYRQQNKPVPALYLGLDAIEPFDPIEAIKAQDDAFLKVLKGASEIDLSADRLMAILTNIIATCGLLGMFGGFLFLVQSVLFILGMK